MTWLIVGIVLWTALHMIPVLATGVRQHAIDRLGSNAYRGLFSMAVLISIAAMIYGWRTADVVTVYQATEPRTVVVSVTIFVSFFFFASVYTRGYTRRRFRHPMLMAVMLWGIAHLLVNGDNRSLLLFGGFAAWAFVTMPLLSLRDGPWQPPSDAGIAGDLTAVAIAGGVFALIAWLHPRLFGVPAVAFLS